ncbi:hypothetical protein KFK09_016825 [Dendrobium nobile]|uniref:Uncharacterized protein n=1 Tax=Dendrobium nobile TaxID=94219 RepID=A0A8T3B0K4_DENNO|nr:hypothetical protein KFK09_016825 [Dendrobium nobile]
MREGIVKKSRRENLLENERPKEPNNKECPHNLERTNLRTMGETINGIVAVVSAKREVPESIAQGGGARRKS